MDLPKTSISLFSGAGGLDLGLELAVPGLRTVAFVEREAYACEVLAARMEEERLAPAPIHTDVCTFDGKPWRGVVDLVAGGSPCQDLSLAGKCAGLEGERSGLFYEFVRIVDEAKPKWVFWENVAGAKRYMESICGEFSRLGYRGAWIDVRASDVRAPHRRERVFLLAYADPGGQQGFRGAGLFDGERKAYWHDVDRRYRSTLYPPRPDDAMGWGGCWPGPQPSVRRGADGRAGRLDFRVDRLRLTGNGVVPHQAAFAWFTLHDFLTRGQR